MTFVREYHANAEIAKAVTGIRCHHRRLFGASDGSPYENGRNSETKIRIIDPWVSKFSQCRGLRGTASHFAIFVISVLF